MANQKKSKMVDSKTSIGDRPQSLNSKNMMNEPSTSTSEKYQIGDIVWAKIGKYPFWPSMVCNDPTSENYIKRSPKDQKKFSIHVRFFSDNCRRNWVKTLENYSGKDDFLSKHPNCFAGLKISEKQKKSWNYAVNEAVVWSRFKNLEERWMQFSYAYKIRILPSLPKSSSSVTSPNKSSNGVSMAKQKKGTKRALEDFPKASIIDVKTNEKFNIVEGQEFLIGSSLDCSLIIGNIDISSIQCIIKYENSRFVLDDHSATANTYLNGTRLQDCPRVLKHGDIIAVENDGKMSYFYRFVLVTKSTKKFKPKEDNDLVNNLLIENKLLKNENGLMKSNNEQLRREIDKLNLTKVNIKIDYKLFQRGVQETFIKYRKKLNELSVLLDKQKQSIDLKKHCVETLKKQIKRHLEENFQCSICNETIFKATIGNCTHTFCETCLSTWLIRSNRCPVCRTDLNFTTNCLSIDNFMEDICETLGGTLKAQRDSQKRERTTSRSPSVEGSPREARPRLVVQNQNIQLPTGFHIAIDFIPSNRDGIEIVDLTHQ